MYVGILIWTPSIFSCDEVSFRHSLIVVDFVFIYLMYIE